MKQAIIVFLLFILGIWYSAQGKSYYIEDDNKDYLTQKEVNILYKKGVINKPDYNKEYYSERKVSLFKSPSLIPFYFNKDTISDTGINYYSKSK